MTDFERGVVNAFNDFFEKEDLTGIAYRRKQHRFSSQFCDVLVDSPHDSFYLAIENKSIKTSSSNKLYFSQHFSETDDGHQVVRINNFLQKSGRTGFLAVEIRRGRGKPRKAYLLPWDYVWEKYQQNDAGISIEEMQEFPEIFRDSEHYDFQENAVQLFM